MREHDVFFVVDPNAASGVEFLDSIWAFETRRFRDNPEV